MNKGQWTVPVLVPGTPPDIDNKGNIPDECTAIFKNITVYSNTKIFEAIEDAVIDEIQKFYTPQYAVVDALSYLELCAAYADLSGVFTYKKEIITTCGGIVKLVALPTRDRVLYIVNSENQSFSCLLDEHEKKTDNKA